MVEIRIRVFFAITLERTGSDGRQCRKAGYLRTAHAAPAQLAKKLNVCCNLETLPAPRSRICVFTRIQRAAAVFLLPQESPGTAIPRASHCHPTRDVHLRQSHGALKLHGVPIIDDSSDLVSVETDHRCRANLEALSGSRHSRVVSGMGPTHRPSCRGYSSAYNDA